MIPTLHPSHLPVTDPAFRFIPSRNPYWARIKEVVDGGAFLDHDAEAFKGTWKARFAARDPRLAGARLEVEVGCNGGHVLNGWAARDPKTAYLGLDWKYKQIYKAYEKAGKRQLPNALYIRNHADRLPFLFERGEIDRLSVFFPDPWPKKHHWKHRTLREEWFRAVQPLLAADGLLHIKTDHDGYFEWMLAHVERCGDVWEVRESSFDLHRDHPAPASLAIPDVTLFERLFIRDGIKIKSLLLAKRP